MDTDVASARVTKQGEDSGDYDYCANIASDCVPGGLESCKIYKFLFLLLSCASRWWRKVDSRMACFDVAVVPDSDTMIICRSSAIGRVLVRNWQISLCCFVRDVLLFSADY